MSHSSKNSDVSPSDEKRAAVAKYLEDLRNSDVPLIPSQWYDAHCVSRSTPEADAIVRARGSGSSGLHSSLANRYIFGKSIFLRTRPWRAPLGHFSAI